MSKHLTLIDLYPYLHPYNIPLEEASILSRLGQLISKYMRPIIEFKVNCRLATDDQLVSCCSCLLSLNTPNTKKKEKDYTKTDFYIAFNVRRAQSWSEPNSILFQYPTYSNATLQSSSRGIQLDFLASKQLTHVVMGTYIKTKKSKKKSKKRRSSVQPTSIDGEIDTAADDNINNKPKYNVYGYGSKSFTNSYHHPTSPVPRMPSMNKRSCNSNPYKNVSVNNHPRNRIQRSNTSASRGQAHCHGMPPAQIPSNLAIIYPQGNLLWSYFKNNAKIIDQNAWLPIVSLWKQSNTNIIYMLRGSKKGSKVHSPTSGTIIKRKRKRKKVRSRSVQHHIRTHTPSAPIPALSPCEKANKSKKIKTFRAPKSPKSPINKKKYYLKKKKKRVRRKAISSTKEGVIDDITANTSCNTNGKPLPIILPSISTSISYPIVKKRKKRSPYSPYSPLILKKNKKKYKLFDNYADITKKDVNNASPDNPCKFYQITILENEVSCSSLFDFPHLSIDYGLSWFDINTKSLLLITNNNKRVELNIIKHNIFSSLNTNRKAGIITQSTTATLTALNEAKDIKYKPKINVKVKNNNKNKKRKMSASELFHMKLQNDSLKITLTPPKGYLHIFKNVKCLNLFHHKLSNSFILLLEKYSTKKKLKIITKNKENIDISNRTGSQSTKEENEREVLGKLLLKVQIDFNRNEITNMSFGIINDDNNDIMLDDNYDIISYDYNRSLLIIDTFYEPITPLSTNPLSTVNGRMINKNKVSFKRCSPRYEGSYNKWFSFATKKWSKYKVITKKLVAIKLNDFVYSWKNIYKSNDIID